MNEHLTEVVTNSHHNKYYNVRPCMSQSSIDSFCVKIKMVYLVHRYIYIVSPSVAFAYKSVTPTFQRGPKLSMFISVN